MNSRGENDLFQLLTPKDLEQLPEPRWLIEGILPANALGVLYGKPSTFKSFLALSMALSIAAGHSWCGKITEPGPVMYVAAEGLHGFTLRVPAYLNEHEISVEHIRFLGDDGISMLARADIDRLIATLEAAEFAPKLIVLDTLARVRPGADENSAQDMTAIIAAVDRLRTHFSATVLLVHHSDKKGGLERGSSVLRGAADVMFKCDNVSKGGSRSSVSLKCEKMKDAEPFRDMTIALERVQISPSASSLAVIEGPESSGSRHAKKLLEILQTEFASCGATHKELQDRFVQSTGKKESTFDRALRDLKARGHVRQEGDRYYADPAGGGV